MSDQNSRSRDGGPNSESVSRRSILGQIAAGGAVVTGATGLASGSAPGSRKPEKEERYSDPEKAKEVFQGVGQKLLAAFASDHLGSRSAAPSIGELIERDGVSIFTAETGNRDVVHVQVDYVEYELSLVHHVELDRTVAIHYGGDGTTSYVNDASGDGVETLSCNTTIKCSTCECPDDAFEKQQYYRTCCCCGPNSYCDYTAKNTDGNDCCTVSDDCCNFC